MKANLEGWIKVATYGCSLDLYAKEEERMVVERMSGEVLTEYSIKAEGKA